MRQKTIGITMNNTSYLRDLTCLLTCEIKIFQTHVRRGYEYTPQDKKGEG